MLFRIEGLFVYNKEKKIERILTIGHNSTDSKTLIP